MGKFFLKALTTEGNKNEKFSQFKDNFEDAGQTSSAEDLVSPKDENIPESGRGVERMNLPLFYSIGKESKS